MSGARYRIGFIFSSTGALPTVQAIMARLLDQGLEVEGIVCRLRIDPLRLIEWTGAIESPMTLGLVAVVPPAETDEIIAFLSAHSSLPVIALPPALHESSPSDAVHFIFKSLAFRHAAPDTTHALAESRTMSARPASAIETSAAPELMSGAAQHPITFSPEAQCVAQTAWYIARAYDNEQVRSEHFLAAMLDTPHCRAHSALQAASGGLQPLAGYLAGKFAPRSLRPCDTFAYDDSTRQMMRYAVALAARDDRNSLNTLDILRAIVLYLHSPAADALWESGLTAIGLTEAINRIRD